MDKGGNSSGTPGVSTGAGMGLLGPQAAGGPSRGHQPLVGHAAERQVPQVLCNLTFTAGLGPLTLGLFLERAPHKGRPGL